MELLFLGTSSGVPTRQRNVTALAVLPEAGKHWYLFDCGEATQHRLLRTPLSIHKLRAIFITHVHGDHCYGLPGLLASAAMAGRKEPLPIIAPQAIEAWLTATCQLTTLYLPYPIEFMALEGLSEWRDGQFAVQPWPLAHRVPSHGFSVTELNREARLDSDKLRAAQIPPGPLWGQLQRGQDITHQGQVHTASDFLHHPWPARKIVIGGDNEQPALLTEACHGAQLLVHEATYTRPILEKGGASFGHSCAEQVARFAEQVGLPHLLLTHFSPRYQSDVRQSPSIDDIRREAAAHYHGSLHLADDFAHYRLERDGRLQHLNPTDAATTAARKTAAKPA